MNVDDARRRERLRRWFVGTWAIAGIGVLLFRSMDDELAYNWMIELALYGIVVIASVLGLIVTATICTDWLMDTWKKLRAGDEP